MAATVLDRLVTNLSFDVDLSGLRRVESAINRTRRRLDSFAAGAAKVGTALTAAATVSVKEFADFESVMAEIEGLVGINRKQLDAWRSDILEIARESARPPTEVARALFFITSAGLRGAAAIDVLRKSAVAAAAGLGEQQTIADLLTGVLAVYGEENINAAQAVDQLVAAVREGKLDPQTLVGPLSTVLPFAEKVGVEFGEVAGAIAAMSRQNINAARGSTALRGVFVKLLKPTESGKEALAGVGLSMDRIRAIVRDKGLLPALRTLTTAFAGNSDALGKVFENEEALLGVLALTGKTASENARIINSVSGAVGTLGEAIAPVEQTIKFRFQRALVRFRTILLDLGERLRGTATLILDLAERGAKWFDGWSDGAKTMAAHLLALGPILLGLVAAAKAASLALGFFGPSVTAIKAIGVGLKAVIPAVVALKAAFLPAVAAMAAALAPFAAIIAIVVGAAAALYLAWTPISTFFVGLWRGIVEGAGQVGQAVGRLLDAMGPVGDGIRFVFGTIGTSFQAMWDLFSAGLSAIGDAWGWLMRQLSYDATEAGKSFPLAISDGITAVIDSITGMIEWVKNLNLFDVGSALIGTMVLGIKDAALGIKDVLLSAFEGVRDLLPESDAREGPFSRLTQAGRAIIKTLEQGARMEAPNLLDRFANTTLPIGPVPAAALAGAGAVGQSSNQITLTFNQGAIQINAEGGDAREIAGAVQQELREQIRAAVEQADSTVAV